MLPVNLLNALKEYALAQRTPLPVTATSAASKDGQQFELGQKLQGNVQAQVAPNVFKVNVAGQLIQMQLPPSIRSGDTVALQVVALQPRLAFSMANSENPLSTPEQLGSAARLLSSLSQQAPEKAYVRPAQSTPLWATPRPPESGQLAGRLHEALSNSGLFYESHQVQWLGGARTTAQLMHEPQNLAPEQAKAVVGSKAPVQNDQVSARPAMAGEPIGRTADRAAAPADTAQTIAKAAMPADMGGNQTTVKDADNSVLVAGNSSDGKTPAQQAPSSPDGKAAHIPEHLQPLVQQQLNALETHQMLWQGNVWPGQEMEWEVHEQAPQTPDMEAQRQWVTQIHLDLPKLGPVAATLRFNSAGLSLALNADIAQTRTVLGKASNRLVSALADAGIPVLSTQIGNTPRDGQP